MVPWFVLWQCGQAFSFFKEVCEVSISFRDLLRGAGEDLAVSVSWGTTTSQLGQPLPRSVTSLAPIHKVPDGDRIVDNSVEFGEGQT